MFDYVVYDLETNGFSTGNSIIEIGAWKVKGGVVVDKFHTLVNPRCSLSKTTIDITHITDAMLVNELEIHEILPSFFEFCEDLPFLGHNLSFDYRFICAKGSDMELDFTLGGKRQGICTFELAKKLYKKNVPSLKLADLAKHLGVPEIEGMAFHRAPYDAYMTKCIYDRLLFKYSAIVGVSNPVTLQKPSKIVYGEVVNCEAL